MKQQTQAELDAEAAEEARQAAIAFRRSEGQRLGAFLRNGGVLLREEFRGEPIWACASRSGRHFANETVFRWAWEGKLAWYDDGGTKLWLKRRGVAL